MPDQVKVIHVPCPCCGHLSFIELKRTAGKITGIQLHDLAPEELPPGVNEILTIARMVKSAEYLNAFSGAGINP